MRKLWFWIVLLPICALCACGRTVSIEKIAGDQARFTGLSYFLPRGLVDLGITRQVTGTGDKAVDAVTLTVGSVRYVADPTHHYAISINHDLFAADKIVVLVGKNGLLQSITTEAEDETGDILRSLARAPLDILGAGEQREARSPKYEKFDIKMTIDPTDANDRARLDAILRKVMPTIRFRARPLARLPVMSSRSHPHPDCSIDPCFRVAMPYALELISEGRDAGTTGSRTDSEPGESFETGGSAPSRNGGTPVSAETVMATSSDPNDALVVARAVVMLPNKHVVGQIALTRAPFVTKKFDLTFSDGFLTKADLDNPSEVLAFVQIPIDVAKAIVAIPSALFNFQVKQIQADNSLLVAQKQNLEYQRQIIDAQKALLLAGQ